MASLSSPGEEEVIGGVMADAMIGVSLRAQMTTSINPTSKSTEHAMGEQCAFRRWVLRTVTCKQV